MSLAEGVSQTLIYKAYASGAITANTEEDTSTAPGASGAQVLRRVSSTLNLAVDPYQSAEVRKDRQIADYRHGPRRVQGAISGELSPKSYFPFIEAVHRDTSVAELEVDQDDHTSLTADKDASTFTVGSGDLVTSGFHVGDVIRITNLATATTNNNVNFTIKNISGSSNVTMTVTPAPLADASAETTFTITRPGKTTIVPSSSFVSRKFAIEHNAEDLDISRLFTECRASSYSISVPATGMATCDFGFMGRNMKVLSSSNAPYFSSPTDASTTGTLTSVNGMLLAAGSKSGVVTGIDLGMDLSPSAAIVNGQNFPAEIFLGRANMTGTVTAYFDSATLINDFLNETDIALQVVLTTTTDDDSPFVSVYLPRIKFSDANLQLQGEGGQTISLPFQALLENNAATGEVVTTVRIQDSEAGSS
jgi:hypothetical protein